LQGLQFAKAAGFTKRVYILAATDALMSAPRLLPVLKDIARYSFSGPETRYGPAGGIYSIVATADQTGNTHFAIEATEPTGGGPPVHIQTREEERFFVLEGEITFWINGQVINRSVGGTAFVPCGVPHCFKNCSDRPARVLILFTRGGIEEFFDYGRRLPNGGAPSDEILIERSPRWARSTESSWRDRRR